LREIRLMARVYGTNKLAHSRHIWLMKSHKSLLAWQEAKAVTKGVLKLCGTSWKPQYAAVFAQLQRSSVSVQLNIAEGYGFGPSARMCNHFRIAYASAIETADLLELLVESDLFETTPSSDLLERCRKSQRLLTGLLRRYGWLDYARMGPNDPPVDTGKSCDSRR
jgi:four helix bundle protein